MEYSMLVDVCNTQLRLRPMRQAEIQKADVYDPQISSPFGSCTYEHKGVSIVKNLNLYTYSALYYAKLHNPYCQAAFCLRNYVFLPTRLRIPAYATTYFCLRDDVFLPTRLRSPAYAARYSCLRGYVFLPMRLRKCIPAYATTYSCLRDYVFLPTRLRCLCCHLNYMIKT